MIIDRVSRYGCRVLYSNHYIDWDAKKLDEIEDFLGIYLGKAVKLYGVIKEISAFTGKPYWKFYYDEITKGVVA